MPKVVIEDSSGKHILCSGRFLAEQGWYYKPTERPRGIRLGSAHDCHMNAFKTVLEDEDRLFYCEGVACSPGLPPLPHAWVTDGTGSVVEVTWSEPGVMYLGIPIKLAYVAKMISATGSFCLMLSHAADDLRLVRADRTNDELWLEQRGRGAIKNEFYWDDEIESMLPAAYRS